MALYIPHSIFHLARLLYDRPETFGPYYVVLSFSYIYIHASRAPGCAVYLLFSVLPAAFS